MNHRVIDSDCNQFSLVVCLQQNPKRSIRKRTTAMQKLHQLESQDRVLLCLTCGNLITVLGEKLMVNGLHHHTFANPYGHIYQIGCFRTAPGCLVDFMESTEFAWFAGYSWSIALCGFCGIHLGWRFRSGQDMFFGLVVDKLIEAERPTFH